MELVELNIQQGQSRWLRNLIRMDSKRMTNALYEAKRIKKRNRGRPRRKRNDEVKKAVEQRGAERIEKKKNADDRKKWKQRGRYTRILCTVALH